MSNLALLPPHVFAGLLRDGRSRDIDLPKRVAEWVESILRKHRWSRPTAMGSYGLTHRHIQVHVEVDVMAQGVKKRAACMIVLRSHIDTSEEEILADLVADMAGFGAVPAIDR